MGDKYGLMQIPNDLEDTIHILDQLCILKLNLKICTLWKKRNVMKCNPDVLLGLADVLNILVSVV